MGIWFGFIAHQTLLVINTKSIFIHLNSSISNNSVSHKFTVSMSKISSISNNSVEHTKTVLFQTIQSSIGSQFTLHSPKFQHYSNLTIRLFSIIIGHLLGVKYYPCAERQLVYSIAPADWAIKWRGSMCWKDAFKITSFFHCEWNINHWHYPATSAI